MKAKEAFCNPPFRFVNKDKKPTACPKNDMHCRGDHENVIQKWCQKHVEKVRNQRKKNRNTKRIRLSTRTQLKSVSDLLHLNRDSTCRN